MVPSLHAQYIYNADENETNFEKSFTDDLNRNSSLKSFSFENRPKYIESCQYYQQVKRYIDTFEKDNILILLHEELQNDFDATIKKVYSFLGVNPNFTPNKEEVNARRKIKNVKLHHISKEPPTGLKKLFRFIVPFKPWRHSIMQTVENINIGKEETKDIPEHLKNKIIELTKDDTLKLQELIKKDLSAWLK